MKKLFVILLIVSSNFLFPQDESRGAPFSNFGYAVYGGINFETTAKTGGLFLFEAKANLIPDLNLNLSLGYNKTYQPVYYGVKTYRTGTINGTQYYFAEQYFVNEKGYDVFPVSLGIQYVFNNLLLSPYMMFDLSYNFIDTKIYHASGQGGITSYTSFDAMPNEYKTQFNDSFPNHSYGLMMAIGASYNIFRNLNLDIRYSYKIDNEIINTHNLILGFSFM